MEIGFGFGGGIGDSFRDYRQDGEIARERSELEQARLKNMELEQRLAQLERGQASQQLMQSAPAPLQAQDQQQQQQQDQQQQAVPAN